MCLHPIYMEDLIQKAGYTLGTDHASIMVRYLIWEHPDDRLDEWQEKLDEAHVNIKLPKA